MYYNVHTHQHVPQVNVLSIENCNKNFDLPVRGRNVSMGLHPWDLHVDQVEQQFETLRKYAVKPEVLAIGECGLDKLTATDWALQLNAFRFQIAVAQEISKPLIIHCVKAFNEILVELKQVSVPVIIHGVNNKLSILQPLIDQGFYLSFGKSLLTANESVLNTFKATPLEQVFLETDDSDISIEEIYKSAARIRDISEKEIVLQLQKNFLRVFS